MPYSLVFRDTSDFLHAETSGEFHTLEELFAHLESVMEEAAERSKRRVLLDFRQLRAYLESYHATVFTEGLLEKGYPSLGMRFAALVHPDDIEKAVAFETAFLNRSMINKVFLEYDAAQEWLVS